MFITAVCVIFLIKLRWPKTKSLYDNLYLFHQVNKLTSVFRTSVVLLIVNLVITFCYVAVDPQSDSQVDPQTTLTKLWQNLLSITGQTHEKLTSFCFVNKKSGSHCINYKSMCLPTYWQWKIATEHARISTDIVKFVLHVHPRKNFSV